VILPWIDERREATPGRLAIPSLGYHLAARIKTGYFCSYNPHPERPVPWKFYLEVLILLSELLPEVTV
jgi:hypothetical protein